MFSFCEPCLIHVFIHFITFHFVYYFQIITVSPCKPVRSVHPSLASVHIVTSKSFAQKMFWKELVQLSDMFILSGLKQSAYSAVVTYVFVVCVNRMLAMRESGNCQLTFT